MSKKSTAYSRRPIGWRWGGEAGLCIGNALKGTVHCQLEPSDHRGGVFEPADSMHLSGARELLAAVADHSEIRLMVLGLNVRTRIRHYDEAKNELVVDAPPLYRAFARYFTYC